MSENRLVDNKLISDIYDYTLMVLKLSALIRENNFLLYLYIRKKYWYRENF